MKNCKRNKKYKTYQSQKVYNVKGNLHNYNLLKYDSDNFQQWQIQKFKLLKDFFTFGVT